MNSPVDEQKPRFKVEPWPGGGSTVIDTKAHPDHRVIGTLGIPHHHAEMICDALNTRAESQSTELSELRERVKGLEENNRRYQYIRNNYQWRREGESVTDRDAQGLIVVAVPYLSNLDCAASMDFVIDRLLSTGRGRGVNSKIQPSR